MIERPRNIGLGSILRYRFPLTAITSILHRISGILLFLFIPFLLWVFDLSLRSQSSFVQVQQCLQQPVMSFFLWVFLAALVYHLIAGIKHLLMDMGFFEEKRSGKVASAVVLLLSLAFIILLGAWLIW